MSITAKELAQRLHLSAATVSMVLNRRPGISDETRDLVLSEAKRCGYDFSKIKTPPPGTVYLVVYKKHGEVVGDTPFFFQVIEGIETTCRDTGYRLQLFYFNEVAPAAEQIELINNSGCSGVILLGTEMFLEDYRPFQSLHVPLVVLDSYYDELPFTTVLINNARGAFLATNYLVSEGHRNIGYLQSARAISNFEERADGFFRALRQNEIKKNMSYVFRVTPVQGVALSGVLPHTGYAPRAAHRLLRRQRHYRAGLHPRPEGARLSYPRRCVRGGLRRYPLLPAAGAAHDHHLRAQELSGRTGHASAAAAVRRPHPAAGKGGDIHRAGEALHRAASQLRPPQQMASLAKKSSSVCRASTWWYTRTGRTSPPARYRILPASTLGAGIML